MRLAILLCLCLTCACSRWARNESVFYGDVYFINTTNAPSIINQHAETHNAGGATTSTSATVPMP